MRRIGLLCSLLSLVLTQETLGPVQPPAGQLINNIPRIGFGTAGILGKRSADVIAGAIEKGFRHIDTAAAYYNEEVVGAGIAEGLRRTGLKRENIWVTTKLWTNKHGELVQQGMNESLKRLNLTYVDLFLMHFPVDTTQKPSRFDHRETWKEMEKLIRPGGPARFIGISNFSPKQVEELLAVATIKPKVHQFELHPYLQQADFVSWHHKNNISVVGYAPLGNTSPYYWIAMAENPTHPPIMTANPILLAIGQERGCSSAAQVTLAWNIKRGVAVIPKAANEGHQAENIRVETCRLTDGDMKKIADISKKYSGRFNNPCKGMGMPCYEGLDHPDQGR